MSMKLSKRMESVRSQMPETVSRDVNEVLKLLQSLSTVKFVESIDVSVNLGLDARKQALRGSVLLPKGTGKKVTVAVLTSSDQVEAAKAAGADIAGEQDLLASIGEGKIDFDVLIATPNMMPAVGKLGTILGPKGLMPNPKLGTVTTDVAGAVKKIKQGQIQYKMDKYSIVHSRIGDVKFDVDDLHENLKAFIAELKRAKPTAAKGVYLKKIVLSTTMGPGLIVDPMSI